MGNLQDDDFDNLLSLHVEGKTSWCELPELRPPGAALLLKPASEANDAYTNASKKMAAKRPRTGVRRGGVGAVMADMAEWQYSEDKVLYPRHVVADWRGIVNKRGEPVPFSTAACELFFSKLPDYLIHRIRNHALIPENFLEDEEPDSAELAKNSPSGSSGS